MKKMDFTTEELALIAFLLDEESKEKTPNRKRRRMWVHEICKKRAIEGEYATLCRDLIDDEPKFFQYFRMSQWSFDILLKKIENSIVKENTHWREAISPRERLAVSLRYLATGDSFRTIALSYRMGSTTVHKIVMETCKAIVKNLLAEVMPAPTGAQWKEIANEFWEKWNFPNCLGALDGKHITIQAPPNSGSKFFNYKKYFSVVLLALVDANYKFVLVDVGSEGKNSDGGIFSRSKMGEGFDNSSLNVPNEQNLPGTTIQSPFTIVADEAFALKSYLLRPYPGKQLADEKKIFNYRLSRARRVVENAFGILAQRFRIYQRRIQCNPENVDYIILATCVLHNFIMSHNENIIHFHDEANKPSRLENIPARGGNATEKAFSIRDTLKDFFNSESGAVPWQHERI